MDVDDPAGPPDVLDGMDRVDDGLEERQEAIRTRERRVPDPTSQVDVHRTGPDKIPTTDREGRPAPSQYVWTGVQNQFGSMIGNKVRRNPTEFQALRRR